MGDFSFRATIQKAYNRDATEVCVLRDFTEADRSVSHGVARVDSDGTLDFTPYRPFQDIEPTFRVEGMDDPRELLRSLRQAINRYLADTEFP